MSSFSIGKKLFLGVGALIVFTLALGITAVVSMANVADRLHTATGAGVKKELLAVRLKAEATEMLSDSRAVLLRGYMAEPAKVDEFNTRLNATAEQLQTDCQTLLSLAARADARAEIQKIMDLTAALREANAEAYAAVKAGDTARASTYLDAKLIPASKEQEAASDRLLQIQNDVVAIDEQSADGLIATSRWLTGSLLAAAMGVGLVIIFLVRQVNTLLRNNVAELSTAVAEIASAASQVASSSQSLAQGASEQAATIEETSSASAEINSMAQRNGENSKTTAELVMNSQARFEDTNQSLTELVEAMDGITSSSQRIFKIIKVIDEIAFQTNILALNAAVEAARAGDAGMGFAVVADEVRSLAQRSAQAAKDTADLIEDSIQRSHSGKEKVDQVGGNIRVVTAESAKVKILVDEINLGSVEQSCGIDQISRSITEMEKVTQSAAAGAEESAAAAEELGSQAKALEEITGRLHAMVGGEPGHGSTLTRQKALRPARSVDRNASRTLKPMRSPTLATPANSFPMDDDFHAF